MDADGFPLPLCKYYGSYELGKNVSGLETPRVTFSTFSDNLFLVCLITLGQIKYSMARHGTAFHSIPFCSIPFSEMLHQYEWLFVKS